MDPATAVRRHRRQERKFGNLRPMLHSNGRNLRCAGMPGSRTQGQAPKDTWMRVLRHRPAWSEARASTHSSVEDSVHSPVHSPVHHPAHSPVHSPAQSLALGPAPTSVPDPVSDPFSDPLWAKPLQARGGRRSFRRRLAAALWMAVAANGALAQSANTGQSPSSTSATNGSVLQVPTTSSLFNPYYGSVQQLTARPEVLRLTLDEALRMGLD